MNDMHEDGRSRLGVLGIAFLYVGVCPGQDPNQEAAKEFTQSFRGPSKDGLVFDLWGPDAEKWVKFEPAGFRITLPAGHPKNGPYVGVNADVAVAGDFEITVSYEILKEPDKADGVHPAVKLVLMGIVDTPQWSPVVLGRIIEAKGESRYSMWRTLGSENPDEKPVQGKQLPTQAKSGRLRMIRTGTVISYHAAEGAAADFQFLHEFPFTGQNLKQVRILGAVGGPNSFLDARVTDLRIRMAPKLNVAQDTAVPGGPNAAPKDGSKGWLAAGLCVALLLTLAFAAVIVYYRAKSRTDGRT